MSKIFIILAFLCLPLAMIAQETKVKDQDVYLELLGGSTMAGINYAQRFNDHTRWGFRAGLSFSYSTAGGFISSNSDSRYWAVPVGINYLIGNRKNNLELGFGASLGINNSHYTYWSMYSEDENEYSITYMDSHTQKENQFGYYFFGDIGYRHVANSGFLFRAGLSPTFNFGGKHAICRTFGDTFRKFSMGFYLGFGWAW